MRGKTPGRRTLTDSLSTGGGGIAPGKRTLTSRLRPSAPSPGPLAPARVAKANRLNPRYLRQLGYDPAIFGAGSSVQSQEFAFAVARYQQQHGLGVDGIAGPITVAHITGGSPSPAAGDSDATTLESGVLGESDVLEPGVLGAADVMEAGVLEPADLLEPGVLDPADLLEPGVLDPARAPSVGPGRRFDDPAMMDAPRDISLFDGRATIDENRAQRARQEEAARAERAAREAQKRREALAQVRQRAGFVDTHADAALAAIHGGGLFELAKAASDAARWLDSTIALVQAESGAEAELLAAAEHAVRACCRVLEAAHLRGLRDPRLETLAAGVRKAISNLEGLGWVNPGPAELARQPRTASAAATHDDPAAMDAPRDIFFLESRPTIDESRAEGAPRWPNLASEGVQLKAARDPAASPADPQAVAATGVEGSGGALPHQAAIQASFGHHDVSGIEAHIGGPAAAAADALGAEAYATGNQVAFRSSPDLHTAAHEAAHVIQQRKGVQLKGGMGQAGDSYERQADAVADQVVRGESAERVLAEPASGGGAASRGAQPVQRRENASEGGTLETEADAGMPSPIVEINLKETRLGKHVKAGGKLRMSRRQTYGAKAEAKAGGLVTEKAEFGQLKIKLKQGVWTELEAKLFKVEESVDLAEMFGREGWTVTRSFEGPKMSTAGFSVVEMKLQMKGDVARLLGELIPPELAEELKVEAVIDLTFDLSPEDFARVNQLFKLADEVDHWKVKAARNDKRIERLEKKRARIGKKLENLKGKDAVRRTQQLMDELISVSDDLHRARVRGERIRTLIDTKLDKMAKLASELKGPAAKMVGKIGRALALKVLPVVNLISTAYDVWEVISLARELWRDWGKPRGKGPQDDSGQEGGSGEAASGRSIGDLAGEGPSSAGGPSEEAGAAGGSGGGGAVLGGAAGDFVETEEAGQAGRDAGPAGPQHEGGTAAIDDPALLEDERAIGPNTEAILALLERLANQGVERGGAAAALDPDLVSSIEDSVAELTPEQLDALLESLEMELEPKLGSQDLASADPYWIAGIIMMEAMRARAQTEPGSAPDATTSDATQTGTEVAGAGERDGSDGTKSTGEGAAAAAVARDGRRFEGLSLGDLALLTQWQSDRLVLVPDRVADLTRRTVAHDDVPYQIKDVILVWEAGENELPTVGGTAFAYGIIVELESAGGRDFDTALFMLAFRAPSEDEGAHFRIGTHDPLVEALQEQSRFPHRDGTDAVKVPPTISTPAFDADVEDALELGGRRLDDTGWSYEVELLLRPTMVRDEHWILNRRGQHQRVVEGERVEVVRRLHFPLVP